MDKDKSIHIVHAEIHELAKDIWEDYGIRLDRINFRWVTNFKMNSYGPDLTLESLSIEMTTYTSENNHD